MVSIIHCAKTQLVTIEICIIKKKSFEPFLTINMMAACGDRKACKKCLKLTSTKETLHRISVTFPLPSPEEGNEFYVYLRTRGRCKLKAYTNRSLTHTRWFR